MAKKDNFFKMELVYNIERRQWIKTVLKRYYSKLANKITGPIFVILGILALRLNQTLGVVLAAIGVIYIIAPYIMVLKNFKKINDSKVIVSLFDNRLMFNYGNNVKKDIPLYSIANIEEDDYFVRIKPFAGDKEFTSEEVVPKENIEKGNIDSFIKTLQNKIDNFHKEKEVVDEETLLLKYSVDKMDILKFVKAEYYSIKRYLFYGAVFLIVGAIFLKNFTGWSMIWGILFLSFGIAYFVYPYLMYILKIRKLEKSEITFYKSGKDKTIVKGNDFRVTTENQKIILIDESPVFSKIILVQNNNMILYIPKDKIIAGSYEKFAKIYEKEKDKKEKAKKKK